MKALDATPGSFCSFQAPDGRVVDVVPLTFGRARITIGDGRFFVDDGW